MAALVVVAAAALGASACGGDDKKSAERTATTSPSPQARGMDGFCEGAEKLAATSFSVDPANRTAVLEALNRIAATAPRSIRAEVYTLRAGSEQLLATFDQQRVAGQNQDAAQLQALAQQSQQVASQVTPALQQVAAFASDNCPGVTLPTIPAAHAGG